MALVSAANSTSQFFAGRRTTARTGRTRRTARSRLCRSWRGRRASRTPSTIAQDDRRQPDRCHGFRLGCRPDRHRAGDPGDRQRYRLTSTTSAWSSSTTTPTAPAAASGRRTAPFAPLLLTSADPTPSNLPGVTVSGRRLRVQHQLGCARRPAESVRPRQQPGRVCLRLRAGVHGAEYHAGRPEAADELGRPSRRHPTDAAARHALRRQGRQRRHDRPRCRNSGSPNTAPST